MDNPMDNPNSLFNKKAPLGNTNLKDIEYFVEFTIRGLRERYRDKITVQQTAMYIYNLYIAPPEQIKEWTIRYWNK